MVRLAHAPRDSSLIPPWAKHEDDRLLWIEDSVCNILSTR